MFAHMTKSMVSFLVLCWSLSILALPPETQLNYKGSLFSHFVSHDLSKPNSQIEKVILRMYQVSGLWFYFKQQTKNDKMRNVF